MSFRLVPKSVTLNDLERHNGVILRCFSEFGYLPGALHKSSRTLSHVLMSSCLPGAEPLWISGMGFSRGRCCSCHPTECDFSTHTGLFLSHPVYRNDYSQITSVLRRRPSSRHCHGACSLPCVASGPFVCSLEASISQSPSYSQQTALCTCNNTALPV